MDLTEEQWELIEPMIPPRLKRADGKGRPPAEPRALLNGMLWILRTGAPWKDLPSRYGDDATCHRRFQLWTRNGTFEKIRRTLLQDLADRGKVKLDEAFVDATFVAAKKGGPALALLNAVKGRRSWQSSTAMALLFPAPSTALPPPKTSSSKKRSK
jgi:transposase